MLEETKGEREKESFTLHLPFSPNFAGVQGQTYGAVCTVSKMTATLSPLGSKWKCCWFISQILKITSVPLTWQNSVTHASFWHKHDIRCSQIIMSKCWSQMQFDHFQNYLSIFQKYLSIGRKNNSNLEIICQILDAVFIRDWNLSYAFNHWSYKCVKNNPQSAMSWWRLYKLKRLGNLIAYLMVNVLKCMGYLLLL